KPACDAAKPARHLVDVLRIGVILPGLLQALRERRPIGFVLRRELELVHRRSTSAAATASRRSTACAPVSPWTSGGATSASSAARSDDHVARRSAYSSTARCSRGVRRRAGAAGTT